MQTFKKVWFTVVEKEKTESRLFMYLLLHQICLHTYLALKTVLGYGDKIVCQNGGKEHLKLIYRENKLS